MIFYIFTYSIYSICFNVDGSQLLTTAGHDVLIYRSIDGHLLHTLKGKIASLEF